MFDVRRSAFIPSPPGEKRAEWATARERLRLSAQPTRNAPPLQPLLNRPVIRKHEQRQPQLIPCPFRQPLEQPPQVITQVPHPPPRRPLRDAAHPLQRLQRVPPRPLPKRPPQLRHPRARVTRQHRPRSPRLKPPRRRRVRAVELHHRQTVHPRILRTFATASSSLPTTCRTRRYPTARRRPCNFRVASRRPRSPPRVPARAR